MIHRSAPPKAMYNSKKSFSLMLIESWTQTLEFLGSISQEKIITNKNTSDDKNNKDDSTNGNPDKK